MLLEAWREYDHQTAHASRLSSVANQACGIAAAFMEYRATWGNGKGVVGVARPVGASTYLVDMSTSLVSCQLNSIKMPFSVAAQLPSIDVIR